MIKALAPLSFCCALLVFFCFALRAGEANAQMPTDKELADSAYYHRRIVIIEARAWTKSDTPEEKKSFGTGFLVSPDGHIITAAHVLRDFSDSTRFEGQRVNIWIATDFGKTELEFGGWATVKLSRDIDAAILRVKKVGILDFPHFCIDFNSQQEIPVGQKIAVASYRYIEKIDGKIVDEWQPVFDNDKKVTLKSGLGEFIDYWGTDATFSSSMSGGAIVANGKVIGVVAKSLEQGAGIISGHNYFTPLRYATEIGWLGRAKDCSGSVAEKAALASIAATVTSEAAPRPAPSSARAWTNSVISTCFLGGSPLARLLVAEAAADLTKGSSIYFDFGRSPLTAECSDTKPANIRVAFEKNAGSWSYLGREALAIGGKLPTMNLQYLAEIDAADQKGFEAARATALHELGHAVGMVHTYLLSSAPCVISFETISNSFGWTKEAVMNNFKKVTDDGGQAFDPDSIMMYSLPAEYFADGKDSRCFIPRQNYVLSDEDRRWIRRMYPLK